MQLVVHHVSAMSDQLLCQWLGAHQPLVPLPPGQNVAELYQEAVRRLIRLAQDLPEPLARDRGIIELIRRVVHQPGCQFLKTVTGHFKTSHLWAL
jgi:hypothetical protein